MDASIVVGGNDPLSSIAHVFLVAGLPAPHWLTAGQLE
jgi:hypothetical protein